MNDVIPKNELMMPEVGLVEMMEGVNRSDLSPYHLYLMSQTHRSREATAYTLNTLARIFFGSGVQSEFAPWHKITSLMVMGFCEQLQTNKIHRSAKTAHRYLSVLKGMMRQVYLSGQISLDDYNRITEIKGRFGSSESKGRSLDERESQIFLEFLEQDNSIYGVRDVAIVAMYLACGIRRAELVKLKLSDIKLEERTFKIHAKGGKIRIIHMPPGVDVLINRWVHQVRGNEPGALFCPIHKSNEQLQKDKHGQIKHFNVRSINALIARRIGKTELKHASPHDFRRSFADRRISSGNTIEVLKELLGHASIATTAIYLTRKNKKEKESADNDDFLTKSGLTTELIAK